MKVGFSFGGREEKERKRWCGVVCGEVRRVEMEFYMGELRRSHVLICAVQCAYWFGSLALQSHVSDG